MDINFIESLKVESYNFLTYNVNEREKFLCGVDIYKDITQEYFRKEKGEEKNIVPLITCGRIEFIYTSSDFLGLDGFEKLSGWSAFSHLVKLSAGINTMIFGETHIVNQIKNAFFSARKNGLCTDKMISLLGEIIRISNLLRKKLNIEEKNFSNFVLSKAEEIFGSLEDKTLFVVGTGAVAHDVFKISSKFKKLIIYSHSREKAEERIRRLKQFLDTEIEFVSSVQEGLEKGDVVVLATRHPGFLVKKENFEKLNQDGVLKDGKKFLIIDFSFPRNADPEIDKFENVFLFNVDSTAILKINPEKLELAEKFISEEIEKIKSRYEYRKSVSYLSEMKIDFENIIFEHLMKYTNLQQDEISIISKSLSKKLLARFFEKEKEKMQD